jgi:hypothetical protein
MDVIFSDEIKVMAAEGQVSTDLAGEAAILNMDTGVYYGLNPVGAFIWNLIQEPKLVKELKEAVLANYDVTPERCDQDVRALLGKLHQAGLIEIQEDAGE